MPGGLGEPVPNALLLLLELVEFREPPLLDLTHGLCGRFGVELHTLPEFRDLLGTDLIEILSEADQLFHHAHFSNRTRPDLPGVRIQEVPDAEVARDLAEIHEGIEIRELLTSRSRDRMMR